MDVTEDPAHPVTSGSGSHGAAPLITGTEGGSKRKQEVNDPFYVVSSETGLFVQGLITMLIIPV